MRLNGCLLFKKKCLEAEAAQRHSLKIAVSKS